MLFPVYDTHFYIGFFVLVWLAYDTFLRYRKNQNISSLYIALASLFLGFSMFCWGFPALFTSNPKTLSFFTFLGDCAQALSFLFLWILLIRAFLGTKSIAKIIASSMAVLLAIAFIIDAMNRNLTAPYTTSIKILSTNTFDIVFATAVSYSILTAINSVSLFLLSFYFWKQGDSAPNSAQKVRVKSLAIAFFCASLINVAMPTIPFGPVELKDMTLTAVLSIIAVSVVISFILAKRKTLLQR